VAEIKSTLELALEKAQRFGVASREELQRERYLEQGRQLAVQYLAAEEEMALEAEVAKLPPEAQAPARDAIKEVLLRNISLPKDGELDNRLSRALAGLLLVASNKKAMLRLKTEVEQLLQNYLTARNSAYQQLKNSFLHSLNSVTRALEQQYQQKVRVEAEHLPQFQEEWRKFQGSLMSQFEPVLEDRKNKMLNL
jgi:hypothetical protein